MSRAVYAERGRVAALSRSRTPDDPELVEARRALADELLAARIARLVAEAPPLTPEQRDRLAGLLRGSAPPGSAAQAQHHPGGRTSPAQRDRAGAA